MLYMTFSLTLRKRGPQAQILRVAGSSRRDDQRRAERRNEPAQRTPLPKRSGPPEAGGRRSATTLPLRAHATFKW